VEFFDRIRGKAAELAYCIKFKLGFVRGLKRINRPETRSPRYLKPGDRVRAKLFPSRLYREVVIKGEHSTSRADFFKVFWIEPIETELGVYDRVSWSVFRQEAIAHPAAWPAYWYCRACGWRKDVSPGDCFKTCQNPACRNRVARFEPFIMKLKDYREYQRNRRTG